MGTSTALRAIGEWIRALTCTLATLLASDALSAAVIFQDDFNRPDGAVGNGWLQFGPSANGTLEVSNGTLSSVQTSNPGAGSAGIYRPLSFTQPLLIEFDLTGSDAGNGTTLFPSSRFESRITVLNDGSIAGGYGVRILRSNNTINNSAIFLEDDGNVIASTPSSFQFLDSLEVSLLFDVDGSVSGTIREDLNEFAFAFSSPGSVSSSGTNLGYLQTQSAGGLLLATTDNLRVTAVPAPPTSALLIIGAVLVLGWTCSTGRHPT